jgi:hypothetical protein
MIVDKEKQEETATGIIEAAMSLIAFKAVLEIADGKCMSKKTILDGYDEITGETLGQILDSFDEKMVSHPELTDGLKEYKESFEQVFAKVKQSYLDAVT